MHLRILPRRSDSVKAETHLTRPWFGFDYNLIDRGLPCKIQAFLIPKWGRDAPRSWLRLACYC
jgi:hypothetical protein